MNKNLYDTLFIKNQNYRVEYENTNNSFEYFIKFSIDKKAKFKDIKIEKFSILTDYNKNKVKNKLGFFGLILLNIVNYLPLRYFPNFYGSCKK